jgi:hypothetical protein
MLLVKLMKFPDTEALPDAELLPVQPTLLHGDEVDAVAFAETKPDSVSEFCPAPAVTRAEAVTPKVAANT